MWITLTVFGFHNSCGARNAWSDPDSNSYYSWAPQSVGCNPLAWSFKSILRRFYLAFLQFVPPDYTLAVFGVIRFSVCNFFSKFDSSLKIGSSTFTDFDARDGSFQQPKNSVWKLSMSWRNGTLLITHLKTSFFSSNERLVSRSKVSKILWF